MANGDIVITPVRGTGSDPTIKFTGPAATTSLTLRSAIDGTTTRLSVEGAAGQLFTVADSMTGTIYSVNDISGIPSIEVLDTGLVKLNEYNGNLQVGGTTNLTGQVILKGTNNSGNLTAGALTVAGGVSIGKALYVGGHIAASFGTVGSGYFGLGTELSSGAAANDTSLRWDGTGGKLNFSFGTSIVGSLTNAGALNVVSTITAGSSIIGPYHVAGASNDWGFGFFNAGPATYGTLMSTATDVTYGGRIAGETTSDYNMYLTMSGGTNRGFVFRNSYATPLLAINGDGVRSNVAVSLASTLVVTGQTTLKEVKDTVYTITDAAAFEIDPVNGSIQKVTLGASRSPAATNFESGQVVLLKIADGTAYTITWPSVTWVGGTAPTLATTGYSLVLLWKDGDALYGKHVGDVA